MAEYIDRADLIQNLKKFAPEHYSDLINQLITKQPTVEVTEVKHGQWIKNRPNRQQMERFHSMGLAKSMALNSIYWTCSCCGSWCSLSQKYCSECGAKMDGRSDA